jgi:hypothetical protein
MDTKMLLRAAVGAAAAVSLLAGHAPRAHAQTPPPGSSPPCDFKLGFAELARLVGSSVGRCLEHQRTTADGNAEQRTTSGLMVWRKADNWTAYTDGYRTWLNGPHGLEQRLNTQRFSWEPDAGAPGTSPVPPPAPPAPVAAPEPAPLVPGTQLGVPVTGPTLTMTPLAFHHAGPGLSGSRLVTVTVKVQRGVGRVGKYESWDFRLRSPEGVEYRPSALDQGRPGSLSSGTLTGDQFVVGDLWFEVPATAGGYGLHYYPSGLSDARVAISRWLGGAA